MSDDSPIRSARFTLTRELGSGGFGVVHLAHDRERNEHVALKLLKEMDAGSLFRFKNEFRSLADIIHPNLVSLHELVCEEGQWFFTMELIEGVDFLTHVFGGKSPGLEDRPTEKTLPVEEVGEGRLPDPRPVPADLTRLRPALRQLVEGVAALHATGKLHCDIKPGNVLVAKDRRVVLLDFGLVKELSSDPARSTQIGTPMYMAPEQIQGLQLTEATDWYAVGVLLYQALTGKNPYQVSERVVLTRKQTEDPAPPREVARDVPDDLDRICMTMLARDPNSRPKDAEVVRILAGIEQASGAKPTPLLGRQQEWQALDLALDLVKSGQMVVVHTFGQSGMGKTTLLQRFTDEIAGNDVVVLKGRCFEQESVPYNALDSLMDSLCWYLGGLPRQIVLELVPEDIASLTQLFPVLRSIHAMADSLPSGEVEIEPKEQRRRAFSALRELIGKIARRKTLVLLLDDLQWGDVDSAALLRSLLKPPEPPRILLLACYRTEGIENSPLVQGLRALPQEPGKSEHLDLPITELSRDASLELVKTLLTGEKTDQLAESIAEESKGNPFFIQTLAGFTTRALKDAPEVTDKVSLEKALEAHLDSLSDQARTFLELVAVAGVPVHEKVLRHALGEESVEQTTVRILRSEHLIRTSAIQQRNVVEPYHDQIRSAVVGLLNSDRLRDHHRRLGDAFEKQGGIDPETLAAHFEGAGDRSKASTYVIQAAQRASDALAFDRAAALYWRAVTLQPGRDASETRELKAKLATALSNAGRGSEAAPLFQTAAEGADEQLALERRRRAAEEWMKNGHIDAGLDTLQQVLAARGMKLASTPRRAVFSLLWRRLQLRLRGFKFTQKTEEQIDPAVLAHIDLCWAVWVCLGMADFIRATEFHTLNMMHSLDAGEPYRIARALVMEATYLATTGARSHQRVSDMLELAGRLANQVKSRHARGLVDLGTGFTSYLEGRFRHVHAPCEQAEKQLRGLPGASWELSNARHYLLEGLMYTGRLVQDGELLSSFLEDAESRGDLFGELSLRTHAHTRLLADDQPEKALQTIEHAMSRYTEVGEHISHYWDFYARGQIKLYAGEGLSGWAQVTKKYKRLKRAQVLRVEVARQGAHYLRGRMALCALAEHGHPVPRFLRAAWREARKMERDKTDWGQAGAWLIRAAVLARRGDPGGAQAMLRRAIDVFDAVEMVNWAAAARRGLGCLVGGKEGQHLIAESEEVMMEQRIRDPRRFACMLAPGFDNPGKVGTHGR